jgi:4-amino-4-deoxy-L-arabinose transferase-like glycosyltransferase
MIKFLKSHIFKIILILILCLSFFLRFYQININPPSLDWDEASLGYNAYSILKTGADEYGNKLPLSIRSFDDYKPPIYAYLAVPTVAIFGLNEVGTRLPSATLGFLSVIVMYILVKEIFGNFDKEKKEKIGLLAASMFGVSPWALQFSRAAFEGNVGLFFFLLGFLLFLSALKRPKLILLSAVSFVFSMYSYHSFRLITPVFLLACFIFYFKEILTNKKYYLVAFGLAVLLAMPIAASFFGSGGSSSRLSMVSIFSDPNALGNSVKELEYAKSHGDLIGTLVRNRRVVYSLLTAKSYFDHWNPDFLFFHGDGGRQHHAVDMGMLYLWDLPFILMGIYGLLKYRTKKILLLLVMFLVAPLPSAVATGSPHPVRAIAMSGAFSIFSAAGVFFLFFNGNRVKRKILLIIVSLLFVVNFTYYLHQYYVDTPVIYGDFWQYGNKQAVAKAKSLEAKYSRIIFTYKYDQPYIYYLFYNRIDPSWYQKHWDYLHNGQTDRMERVIGKYDFRNIDWGKDSQLKNALLIGSPDEIPANAKGIIDTIYFPNGVVAYRIVGT